MYKSNSYCSVPQCTSRYDDGVSFHKFPNELKLRLKWGSILKITKEITKGMCVCSKHFVKSDFILPDFINKKRRLKRNAVPSQYLPIKIEEIGTDDEKLQKSDATYTNEEGSVKLDYNDLLAVKALIYLKNSVPVAQKITIDNELKATEEQLLLDTVRLTAYTILPDETKDAEVMEYFRAMSETTFLSCANAL